MTWQRRRDLKPRLSAANVIQLSIGYFRDVPCSAFGPVLIVVARPVSAAAHPDAWFGLLSESSKAPVKSQVLEEASFIHESPGRLNKLIKNMAGSWLCSRGMGLGLMSSFTSADIAGGVHTTKRCDKAGVTAASPLLFKSVCALERENEGEASRGESLHCRGGRSAALITILRSL